MQQSAPPQPLRMPSPLDAGIRVLDRTLRTLAAPPRAQRPCPASDTPDEPLNAEEQALSAALMRVNHVGEVCAQALYTAQSLTSRDPAVAAQLESAAQEEIDHLAWTQARIAALGGRTSLLLPLWWGGAFSIGLAAGLAGDRWSLGFVVETERQVEAHLAGHLSRLPEKDHASRAIVAQMQTDEAAHADLAAQAGAAQLPAVIQGAMRWAARAMTGVAHRI